MKLVELKTAINDIRQAVKICQTINDLHHNANMTPDYEYSDNKYHLHVTQHVTTDFSNVTETMTKNEKDVIVAQKFRNADNLIVYQTTIKDSFQSLAHGLYKTEYSGLPAFLIYRRLKKEYTKQQQELQK
ncbi:MAG: hypothetical protein J6T57_01405 [Alphaproteobacteria bacterium]|nr:hypothetical protein [Alphaproteobacteria bacterium]